MDLQSDFFHRLPYASLIGEGYLNSQLISDLFDILSDISPMLLSIVSFRGTWFSLTRFTFQLLNLSFKRFDLLLSSSYLFYSLLDSGKHGEIILLLFYKLICHFVTRVEIPAILLILLLSLLHQSLFDWIFWFLFFLVRYLFHLFFWYLLNTHKRFGINLILLLVSLVDLLDKCIQLRSPHLQVFLQPFEHLFEDNPFPTKVVYVITKALIVSLSLGVSHIGFVQSILNHLSLMNHDPRSLTITHTDARSCLLPLDLQNVMIH